MKISLLTLIIAGLAPVVVAQTPPDNTEAELLALLSTPVSVASASATTLREAPGVITVYTRDMIAQLGAQDLAGILRFVPGFSTIEDVQGMTGINVRGILSYEGKILVIIDGIEMPELLFGTFPLMAGRLPSDAIEKIEIIRGPGSATYGGFAETAVVKITTATRSGASFLASKHQTISSFNYAGGGKFRFNIGGDLSGGQLGSATYTVADGSTPAFRDQSATHASSIRLGVSNESLSVNTMHEGFSSQNPDIGVTGLKQRTTFETSAAAVKYGWKLSDSLTLTPQFSWTRSTPWVMEWTSETGNHTKQRVVERMKAGVSASWQVSKSMGLNFGAEQYRDAARVISGSVNEDGSQTTITADGKESVNFNSTAGFFELGYNGPVNLTIGGRYENHSAAGSRFVPRLAITKAWDKLHMKALYAQAFRTPNVANLGMLSEGVASVTSEKTSTTELELGYRIGSWFLTGNLFQIHLSSPLVWNNKGYRNGDDVASRGLEAEVKKVASWGSISFSVSHHEATENHVADWSVPERGSEFIGVPTTKFTSQIGYKLGESFSVNGSAIWEEKRWGYDYDAGTQGLVIKSFDPSLVANIGLQYTHGKWNASIWVHDMLDKAPRIIQGYNGGMTPMPSTGRELALKIRWGF